MKHAYMATKKHEDLKSLVSHFVLLPDFVQKVHTNLNQMHLTDEEISVCARATD